MDRFTKFIVSVIPHKTRTKIAKYMTLTNSESIILSTNKTASTLFVSGNVVKKLEDAKEEEAPISLPNNNLSNLARQALNGTP